MELISSPSTKFFKNVSPLGYLLISVLLGIIAVFEWRAILLGLPLAVLSFTIRNDRRKLLDEVYDTGTSLKIVKDNHTEVIDYAEIDSIRSYNGKQFTTVYVKLKKPNLWGLELTFIKKFEFNPIKESMLSQLQKKTEASKG